MKHTTKQNIVAAALVASSAAGVAAPSNVLASGAGSTTPVSVTTPDYRDVPVNTKRFNENGEEVQYVHESSYSTPMTSPDRFRAGAPVIAIEDIIQFRNATFKKGEARANALNRETEACYSTGNMQQTAKPGTHAAKLSSPPNLSRFQELQKQGEAALALPDGPAKRAKIAEIQAQQMAEVAGMTANAPKPNVSAVPPSANMRFPGGLPLFPGVPGGMEGKMADAINKQMQAATNPAVAQCIDRTVKKHDVALSDAESAYSDLKFDEIEQYLKEGSQVVYFAGRNIVSRDRPGPYNSKIVSLESVMKNPLIFSEGSVALVVVPRRDNPLPESRKDTNSEAPRKFGEALNTLNGMMKGWGR